MAAATVDETKVEHNVPFVVTRVQLSALTSDQNEDVAHGGPTGVAPLMVIPIVTVGATTGDQVTAEWIKASDSTSNNTVRVKARVAAGGDITGAKLTLFVVFASHATAGLNPP